MNVDVEEVLGVSTMYAMTVGNEDASDSNKMLPEADQTKTSICPGVSTKKYFGDIAETSSGGCDRFSRSEMTWSIFVANKFKDVRIPPLGPRLYCFMTSL